LINKIKIQIMNRQEFFEIAGYFANPIRNSRIELEAREITINNYATHYLAMTGLPLPVGSDSITSLTNDADKWGREMRLYFTLTDQLGIPQLVDQLKTVGGRYGYDLWDQRLNNKDIIDDLLQIGFTLGEPQDETRIRGFIEITDLIYFNNGFKRP
jgi:hypothetical protein